MKYVALYLLILNTFPNFNSSETKEYTAFIGFDNLIVFNQKKYNIQVEKKYSEAFLIKTFNSKTFIHPLECVGINEVKLYLMKKNKKLDSFYLKLEYPENGTCEIGNFETIFNKEDLLKDQKIIYYNPYRKRSSSVYNIMNYEVISTYSKRPMEERYLNSTNFSDIFDNDVAFDDLKSLHVLDIQASNPLNQLLKKMPDKTYYFGNQRLPYPLYQYSEEGFAWENNQLSFYSNSNIQQALNETGIKDSLYTMYAQHADSIQKTPLYKRFYNKGQMIWENKYDLNTLALKQTKTRINDSMQQITIFHRDGSKAFEGIAILNTPNREYRMNKQVPVELSTSELDEMYRNIPSEYFPMGLWKAYDPEGKLLLSIEFKSEIDSTAKKDKGFEIIDNKSKLKVLLNPIPYSIRPKGECLQYNSEGQLKMIHLFED